MDYAQPIIISTTQSPDSGNLKQYEITTANRKYLLIEEDTGEVSLLPDHTPVTFIRRGNELHIDFQMKSGHMHFKATITKAFIAKVTEQMYTTGTRGWVRNW